jgi:hypothetical protein
VFHELQNTGRHVERLLTKTVSGVATRVVTHGATKNDPASAQTAAAATVWH